jgi:hypothetical protein
MPDFSISFVMVHCGISRPVKVSNTLCSYAWSELQSHKEWIKTELKSNRHVAPVKVTYFIQWQMSKVTVEFWRTPKIICLVRTGWGSLRTGCWCRDALDLREWNQRELHNLYRSPDIIKIRLMWMRWAGHVADGGYEKCTTKLKSQTLKRRHDLGDLAGG